WRGTRMPGLSRANVRLGEPVTVTFLEVPKEVRVSAPGGRPRKVPVQERQVAGRAAEGGGHEGRTPERTWSVAANALAAAESDLRDCSTGDWGDWLDETTLRLEYVGVSWVVLLLLLGLVTLHLFLATGGRVKP